MPKALHTPLSVVIAGAVGIWLFGDTLGHCWPGPRAPNTIRFAHFGTFQDHRTWARVIEAFGEEHPEVTVEQEYVVGWYGLYDAKLRQQMLAGVMPHVVLVQIGPFTALAEKFADLTGFVEAAETGIDLAAFDPTASALFRFEGRVRALPVSGGNLLIYCNPECFERASAHHGRRIELPRDNWSMEGFRRLAQDLTCDFDGDGRIDQFGFWQPRWVYYLPFIWSFGADLLDDTLTRWRLHGPEAEAAFAFYQQMRVGPRRYSPHPHEVSQIIQDVGFLTGKTAICINGPWFQPFLAETKLAHTYHVAHIPEGPAGRVTRVTWDGIAMAPGLDDHSARLAWAFLRFVCGDEAQRILATGGRAVPARTSAAAAFGRGTADRRAHRFTEALSYSRTSARTTHFTTIDRALNSHLRDLLDPRRPITPAAFLDRLSADDRIRSIGDAHR